jgi:D-glycero-beta-D-manno-heptose 1-phosphate adenylyltransferase
MPKNYLQFIKDKIIQLDQVEKTMNYCRFLNQSIVFTNGCFDILHPGHTQYLAEAKQLGHILVVGVNSDNSVKQLGKGETRPLQSEQARAFNLAALLVVDYVVIFDEATPQTLIDMVIPNVLVKGGDYVKEKIVGYNTVIKNNGSVQTIPFLEGYSTTAIEQKIKKG